jgi:membrane carboxypeptidase/penicillin-binding protein PbpC
VDISVSVKEAAALPQKPERLEAADVQDAVQAARAAILRLRG